MDLDRFANTLEDRDVTKIQAKNFSIYAPFLANILRLMEKKEKINLSVAKIFVLDRRNNHILLSGNHFLIKIISMMKNFP